MSTGRTLPMADQELDAIRSFQQKVLARTPTQLHIDGAFVNALDGDEFEVRNPATGSIVATLAASGPLDVDNAVRSAERAFHDTWGRWSAEKRGDCLREMARLIDERAEELGVLESTDVGKPFREGIAGARVAADWFRYFADLPRHLRGAVLPTTGDHMTYTRRQALGVVGVITPWNYPLVQYGVKLPAALATGNTVVLKPAERAPLTALALAEIAHEAGVPPGVINVVSGFGSIAGEALVNHPSVRSISFTGSTSVGREVARQGAYALKRLNLELGGKSPNIIFADADLSLAIPAALFSFAVNQGQLCSAGTRVLVESSIHDEVVHRLVEQAEMLRIGDPLAPETQLGSLIDRNHLDRVQGYVRLGKDEGAVLATGGEEEYVEGFEGGAFYRPTVFIGVRSEMRVAQEEVFGPVLSVIPFADEAEAVHLANDVLYGLSAAVWTQDVERAQTIAERVDAGRVYVNTVNVSSPTAPMSGWKSSGPGISGGLEQALQYTDIKTVWLNKGGYAPSL